VKLPFFLLKKNMQTTNLGSTQQR